MGEDEDTEEEEEVTQSWGCNIHMIVRWFREAMEEPNPRLLVLDARRRDTLWTYVQTLKRDSNMSRLGNNTTQMSSPSPTKRKVKVMTSMLS